MTEADVSYFGSDPQRASGEFVFSCHGARQIIPCHQMPTWRSGRLGDSGKPITLVWSNLEAYFEEPTALVRKQTKEFDRLTSAIDALRHYYETRRGQGARAVFYDRAIIDRAVDTLMLFRAEDPNAVITPLREPPAVLPAVPMTPDEAAIGSLNGSVFRCSDCNTAHGRGPVDNGRSKSGFVYPRYCCAVCQPDWPGHR
jgi:hypothetical protein